MRIMPHERTRSPEPRPAGRFNITQRDAEWRATLVRETLSATGMGQNELARRLGIRPVQVSRWVTLTSPVPERWLPVLAAMMEAA